MIILKGIGLALLGIGLFLLVIFVIMRLWNWLIPPLFRGPRLQFMQALGLFVLVRLLVGVTGVSHGHFLNGRWHGPWRHGNETHRWHHPDRNQSVSPPDSVRLRETPGN